MAYEKISLSIMDILKSSGPLITGTDIRAQLVASGMGASERTVRYHLNLLVKDRKLHRIGKKGYQITEEGLLELDSSNLMRKSGFLTARINRLVYAMNFNPAVNTGTVIVNLTLVKAPVLKKYLYLIQKVFEKGLAMGELLALIPDGEKIGENAVPSGMIGVITVCSMTLNGILLRQGVPAYPRFAGLLEIRNNNPTGFTDFIMYSGNSLDPLELFIRSGMTDYTGAVTSGCGRIGAGFREFPAESLNTVQSAVRALENSRLCGMVKIGSPVQALLRIPVSEGSIGTVVAGGINPAAIFAEHGVKIFSRAMAGIFDYSGLFHYSELSDRLRSFRA